MHCSWQESRVSYGKKRVGRPRQNWLHYAKKHTFEHILGGYDYTETVAEDSQIYDAALNHSNFLICKYATASFGYANALHYMTEVSAGYGWEKESRVFLQTQGPLRAVIARQMPGPTLASSSAKLLCRQLL